MAAKKVGRRAKAVSAPKASRRSMSAEHKEALAAGRTQGAAVRRYLNYLDGQKQRQRRVSPEEMERKLAQIKANLQTADPITQLQLHQQRITIEQRLRNTSSDVGDGSDIESQFVEAVVDYSARKGITWSAWRSMGVPAAVLSRAGLSRKR